MSTKSGTGAGRSVSVLGGGDATGGEALDVGVAVTGFAQDFRAVFAQAWRMAVRHFIGARPMAGQRHFAQPAFAGVIAFAEKTDGFEVRIFEHVANGFHRRRRNVGFAQQLFPFGIAAQLQVLGGEGIDLGDVARTRLVAAEARVAVEHRLLADQLEK